MPVRIRLQRHGRKGRPFYWIVAADSRSRRDGRYLEKLGTYDPNVNPAIVNIKVNEAVKWLENGAQPSDTASTLLSYKGVMLRHHLNKGVKKGALTVEQADKKFENWVSDKEKKIQDKIKNLLEDENKKLESKIKSEREYSLKREEKVCARKEKYKIDCNAKKPNFEFVQICGVVVGGVEERMGSFPALR